MSLRWLARNGAILIILTMLLSACILAFPASAGDVDNVGTVERYLNEGEIDKAVDILEKVIELKPMNGRFHYLMGRACSIKAGIDDALERRLEYITEPISSKIYSKDSLNGVDQALLEKALIELRLAINGDPAETDAYIELAKISWLKGSIAEADMLFKDAVRSRRMRHTTSAGVPMDEEILYGLFLLDQGKTYELKILMGDSYYLFRDNIERRESGWLGVYGMLSFIEGDFRSSSRALSLYISSRGKCAPYLWKSLVSSLLEEGRFDEAIAVIDRADDVECGSALIYSYQGYIHRMKGDYIKAKNAYEKALRLEADSIRDMISLSGVYLRLQDYHSARRILESSLIKAPDSLKCTVEIMLAEALYNLNRGEEALELLYRAKICQPDNILAQIRYNRYLYSNSSINRQRPIQSGGSEPDRARDAYTDSTAPEGRFTLLGDPLRDEPVILGLSFNDSGSGLMGFWISVDGVEWDWYNWHSSRFISSEVKNKGSFPVHLLLFDNSENLRSITERYDLDVQGPKGEIRILRDTLKRIDRSVEVELRAEDKGSRVESMCFSEDGMNWSDWEPFSQRKLWCFSSGEGEMRLYVRFMDRFGNQSETLFDTILIDFKAPAIMDVRVDETGGRYAVVTWRTDESSDSEVRIEGAYGESGRVYVDEHVTLHRVRIDGLDFSTRYWFRVVSKDLSGNQSVSDQYSFRTLDPDITPPAGSITIIDNDGYTNSQQVWLDIRAWDDSKGEIYYQIGSEQQYWSEWRLLEGRVRWILERYDGMQRVRVRFKDSSGNVSPIYADSTILDTQRPRAFAVRTIVTGTDSVRIEWSSDEECRGEIIYTDDRIQRTARDDWFSYNHSITIRGLSPGTRYSYKIRIYDRAGNEGISDNYYFTTQGSMGPSPTGSINIEDGREAVKSRNVTLSITARAIPGDLSMSLSENGRNWGPWERYSAKRSWRLSGGDGTKSVYVRFRDSMGRVSDVYSDTIILDTKAPVISQINAGNITDRSAVISFRTNEDCSVLLEYGANQRFDIRMNIKGSEASADAVGTVGEIIGEIVRDIVIPNPRDNTDRYFGRDFRVTLRSLSPSTTYSFRIRAYDKAGNESVSPVRSFKTLGDSGPGIPPEPGRPINLALSANGARATASTSSSGCDPVRAIDGNTMTFWQSKLPPGPLGNIEYIEVILRKASTMKELVIKAPSSEAPSAVTIRYSPDGRRWIELMKIDEKSFTGRVSTEGNIFRISIPLNDIVGVRIRLEIRSVRKEGSKATVNELEVLGVER